MCCASNVLLMAIHIQLLHSLQPTLLLLIWCRLVLAGADARYVSYYGSKLWRPIDMTDESYHQCHSSTLPHPNRFSS
ncbi:hypothetical protein V1515DRAFT_604540 [Lipomyces mesembrius]